MTRLYVFIICLFILLLYRYISVSNDYKNPHTSVVQTIWDKSLIPKEIHDNWDRYHPGVRIVLDDKECLRFLGKYFGERYVSKYNSIKKGAHRADLFRYAWLYKNGGIYCDIKTELIKPIDEIFIDDKKCYMVYTGRSRIYNGIIATPPNNPIMFKLLEDVVLNFDIKGKNYLWICQSGYKIIQGLCANGNIQRGDNYLLNDDMPVVHFFQERYRPKRECVQGVDRYKVCTFIYDWFGNKILKVRHHKYPWKKQLSE